MDSPPECVLVLPCDPPQTSPPLPSLDHSPLPLQHTPPSPQLQQDEQDEQEEEEEEEDEDEMSAPAFGGAGVGFGALERALSSSQDPLSSAELDLQLFHSGRAGGAGPEGAGPGAGLQLRFPCKVCGKRFRFNSILSLHARAHALDRDRQNPAPSPEATPLTPPFPEEATPLTPPFPEEATPLTPPLPEEAGPASPPAPAFRCHACKGKFRTPGELARHVRILHSPYRCSLCAFSASREEALASHLQESHPPQSPAPSPAPGPAPGPAPLPLPAFRCETCGQRFTQSWFLKGHMRKHKASLDHKCQVCGRGFKEPWFLKNHMKVHLNKLGLKAGGAAGGGASGGGAGEQSKPPPSSPAFGALYSSLLLSHGGGARAGPGEGGEPSKASLLGYLGLPGDGGGSCMERLQAVAQVAERGGAKGAGGAAVWQLVAHSLASGQQGQQRGQKSSVAGEAEQVRAYLEGLLARADGRGDARVWECPSCGKLLATLPQAVAHARVHTHRPPRHQHSKPSHAPKLHTPKTSPPLLHPAGGVHSAIGHSQGENGLRGSVRERVRGTGVKDCPYCGKAFRSSHHLKVHLRVHTGERPYKCPHCDYAGTQSGSLKYHLQRHHREQRNSAPPLPSSLPHLPPSPHHHTPQEGPFSRADISTDPAPSPVPRHAPAWPQERKASGPQRGGARGGADLEALPYSMGAMAGAFARGAQRGWSRVPSAKQPKTSRRKPLTTTRLPPLGDAFEPLDLSRRPPLEAGGGVTLSQCLFCPFRTSSAELMAMHLQVNHTSKSRRKRASPSNGPAPAPHPLALWTCSSWPASRAATANGFTLREEGSGSSPQNPCTPRPGPSQGQEEGLGGPEEDEEMEEGGENVSSHGDPPGQDEGKVLAQPPSPQVCEEGE